MDFGSHRKISWNLFWERIIFSPGPGACILQNTKAGGGNGAGGKKEKWGSEEQNEASDMARELELVETRELKVQLPFLRWRHRGGNINNS